jgi:hypothetical protein
MVVSGTFRVSRAAANAAVLCCCTCALDGILPLAKVPLTRADSGAKGTRTPNPLLAKQVRYLLRHGPSVNYSPRSEVVPRPRRNPHQASKSPDVRAIGLVAPSAAFCVMLPTGGQRTRW